VTALNGGTAADPGVVDAHSMNPALVIRMAQSMGGVLKRILLVGCEPATLGPDEGKLGLSDEVQPAVDEAVTLVLDLVREIRDGPPMRPIFAGFLRERIV